jgi:hypothetical protein
MSSPRADLSRRSRSVAATWASCAIGLAVILFCQRSLGQLIAPGHLGGWAVLAGLGGWGAIPAALALGLALAVVVHAARWLSSVVTAVRPRWEPGWIAAAPVRWHAARAGFSARAPWLRGWSSRGPPATALAD